MDMIFIAALAVFALLGAVMFFVPEKCTRADKRDDPKAVAQVRYGGIVFMIAAVCAALLALKYTLW
ncbi:MAG: hypothetical protein IKP78_05075 [Ruminococcus sp.]|nr:hypothetical protein [Ruminococcus sp.]